MHQEVFYKKVFVPTSFFCYLRGHIRIRQSFKTLVFEENRLLVAADRGLPKLVKNAGGWCAATMLHFCQCRSRSGYLCRILHLHTLVVGRGFAFNQKRRFLDLLGFFVNFSPCWSVDTRCCVKNCCKGD